MPRPRKQRVDAAVVLTAADSARRELWEVIADAIREAILAGSIRAGASLVEVDLASRFQVSRGPIRDALRDLAREGLVVDLPRRGTMVSTITFTDLQEVYEVRDGLEMAAVRLAVARASDVDLGALTALVDSLERTWDQQAGYGESLGADLAFHSRLVALSGNSRLIASYDQMVVQTQLHAVNAADVNPRLRRPMKRTAHRNIINAMVAHSPERSARAVADHYTYARERLFAGYSARPTWRSRAEEPTRRGVSVKIARPGPIDAN